MPRSNNTLSGCLESTFASGLSTFLLVHAVVSASVPTRTITGMRKDMKTSVNRNPNRPECLILLAFFARGWGILNLLQRGFKRRLQQCLGINLWIAVAEHRVARHQNFCSGPYYLAY